MKVKGKVKHLNMEGGFWGIVGDDGKEYRPVNMPEQLKKDGAAVEVRLRHVEEEMSLYMWGEAVEVTGFHTLG